MPRLARWPSPSAAGSGKSLTLGTKDFTEEFILGSLYKLALQAKGYTVNYKANIGATEVIDNYVPSMNGKRETVSYQLSGLVG